MTRPRTYVETFGYVAALAALGHTPSTIAKHLGIALRTSFRYASGDTPVPLTVSLLLDAWLQHGGPPRLRPLTRKHAAAANGHPAGD